MKKQQTHNEEELILEDIGSNTESKTCNNKPQYEVKQNELFCPKYMKNWID